MAIAGFPGSGAGFTGVAIPPDSTAVEVDLARTGDPLARQIFEVLSTAPIADSVDPDEWRRIQADLTSESEKRQQRAQKKLDAIGSGPARMSHVGAMDACCLILYEAGLTCEQLAIVFGKAKGHIARKVHTASDNYRKAVESSGKAPSTIEEPGTTRYERRVLRAWAQRVYGKMLKLPVSHRRFFVKALNEKLRSLRKL